MNQVIDSFTGEYGWLSNFWIAPFFAGALGEKVSTVEHAYQALKTLKPEERRWVLDANTPGEAKRRGRRIILRSDWESVKLILMKSLIQDKFSRNPDLFTLLLSTGNTKLVEGNHWGDTYWGICRDVGENNLGKILMEVRSGLSNS